MITDSKPDPSLQAKEVNLAALARQYVPAGNKGGWESILGKAKRDRSFRTAIKLGAEWRAKANAAGK
jgi:hypothetical protein